MEILIGQTFKIDLNTQTSQCDKFAHVAFEIDLDQPLQRQVYIDGEIQSLEGFLLFVIY